MPKQQRAGQPHIQAALAHIRAADPIMRQLIAAPWRPYATVGSWYCWRSLDLKRNVTQKEKGYPT